MQRIRFTDGWGFRPKQPRFGGFFGAVEPYVEVTLPHDAMLGTARVAEAGPANGYFPGGSWEYAKTFAVPAEHAGKRMFLHFEGVYRDAVVEVNGIRAAHRPYGYSGFTVRIDELVRPGEDNTVRVEATAGDDSRWYSGAGIYRNVHLLVGDPVRIPVDGLRVTTVDVDREGRAVLEVRTVVENDSTTPVTTTVVVELTGPDGTVVAGDRATVTTWPARPQAVRQRLTIEDAALWSVDRPALHTCTVVVTDADGERDRATTTFGIRTLQLDAVRGLRVNGDVVKLRGACVHHDNGVLGAATIERADERRVELLKAAGFNALRSAHNPMSESMLDACDRLGMLVMDEAFDTWTEPKTPNDYARSFDEWWRADVEAMVAKDVNHPSVVLYSIGNEIRELGHPEGARLAREVAEHVRILDPTRFVTLGLNPVHAAGSEAFADPDAPPLPDLELNAVMTLMQEYLPQALRSGRVATAIEEAFAALDVAGYNYLETCYELDHDRYPNRVIVGTETMPPLIGRYWRLVRDNPHVIGDFTWAGWDYLGEAGIGRIDRANEPSPAGGGLLGPFPSLTAGTGDLDITGHRRPVSYLREIAFGLRTDPYIVVQDPAVFGQKVVHQSAWVLTDGIASWSWPGCEGRPVTVDMYADADEVELLVNGDAVSRAPAGEPVEFRATFDTTYRPGTIEAVAYRAGHEVGRTSLQTAGPEVVLRATADRTELRTDGTDLAYVTIELTDRDGILHHTVDRVVAVQVDGPGVVAGLGSAAPSTEESFLDGVHRTHQGRALAVIRPNGEGTITVTASADGCEPATVIVNCRLPQPSG